MSYPSLLFIPFFALLISCNKMKQSNREGMAYPHTENSNSVFVIPAKQMCLIPSGSFIPQYGSGKKEIKIHSFLLDKTPVTQNEFLCFVKAFPQWRRSKCKRIFADENYLHNWISDTVLGKNINPNAPVVNISWFAATAYAEACQKRLPSMDEWEFVAKADQQSADARNKSSYTQSILKWYEDRNAWKQSCGQAPANFFGIQDMNVLVWEWISDFNAVLISGENRSEGKDNGLFCGSGSVGASDLMNYAAFMRYAYRGSLKASYCVQNLGFRCAKNDENEN
ncbi:MAG TPA: formylglycine-generating enzyme family protein [Chitinophagaceae bacterium]|nr:formylglycine-generating enzyme family protein [Chitinophagaceae bacterium]HNF71876.1 formylglycine-generating enzyme family protein [Chitinophagaceae bacterium]